MIRKLAVLFLAAGASLLPNEIAWASQSGAASQQQAGSQASLHDRHQHHKHNGTRTYHRHHHKSSSTKH